MNRSPFKRHSKEKKMGLGQKVALSLGKAVKHLKKEPTLFRSEEYRRNVASLRCCRCHRPGFNQCAHANYGKGMGIKVSDLMTFSLCVECHSEHDQGGIEREERRRLEAEYILLTRVALFSLGLFPIAKEEEFYREYQRFLSLED